jgi:hypothetical protein
MKTDPGYYWVKTHSRSQWYIAHFDGDMYRVVSEFGYKVLNKPYQIMQPRICDPIEQKPIKYGYDQADDFEKYPLSGGA